MATLHMPSLHGPSRRDEPSAGPGRPRLIANFVLFQSAWFACVMGAAHDGLAVTAGTGAALLAVALHVALSARPIGELELAMAAAVIGLVWETFLIQIGVVVVPHGEWIAGIAPPWIVAMWALFATTLNYSLGWLRGRWMLAAVLGAIAGPLSYWAGVRMGALQFVDPLQAVVALAIGWGVATPLLLALAQRFSGGPAVAGEERL
jgi:hypothetical protein